MEDKYIIEWSNKKGENWYEWDSYPYEKPARDKLKELIENQKDRKFRLVVVYETREILK